MFTVNEIEMRGPARVRMKIIQSIQARVPAIQASMRTQWNLDEQTFPPIENYDTGEPRAFANNQRHALVVVNVINAENSTVMDIDDSGAEQFLNRYPVRVYTYIKTDPNSGSDSYSLAVQLRDMTVTAVRSALLYDVSFGTPDMQLVHSTFNEQYSDITPIKGNRWIAAAYDAFTVQMEEQLVRPLLGYAEHISTDIELLERNSTQNV